VIDVTLGLLSTMFDNEEWLMTCITVRRPYYDNCDSEQIVKRKQTRTVAHSVTCARTRRVSGGVFCWTTATEAVCPR